MAQQLAQGLTIPWMGNDTVQIDGELNIGGTVDLGTILGRAMELVLIFAGIGLFLMLISGGFTLLTSAGDSKKLDQGKQRLTYAFLGFIIIFGAFWLVQIFGTIFGFQAITESFG